MGVDVFNISKMSKIPFIKFYISFGNKITWITNNAKLTLPFVSINLFIQTFSLEDHKDFSFPFFF